MTVDDLAGAIEERLGPVPESMLEAQAERWEKSIPSAAFRCRRT